MRSVSVRLADLDRMKINLGFAGENEHTHVLFDCKKAFEQYPNATPFLIVTPPRGDIYPAVVTRDGDIVEWVVTDSDLIYHGNGKVQLQFQQNNIVMKSYEARTSIAESSEPTGTVPTPIQNWITQANAILAAIPDDINAALAAAKASGEFDGADGVGIAAITLKSSVGLVDTYTITLTDGSDYDFTVTNGTPGQNGVGIQSIAKTSTVGLVDTYTVTLTNGQTYPFTVTNGQNGVEIDDTTPANNKVFSSAKVDEMDTQLLNAIQGKPETVNTDAEDVSMDLIDSDGYVIVRLKNGHIETQKFNSREAINPIEYKFSGDDLLLAYGYNDTYDAVVALNEGRANDLFDFSDLKLKQKGADLKGLETADLTSVWHSGTDMHGPFEFLAVNNPDGYHYDSTDPGWTGGIHTVTIDGNTIKTAKTKYLHFFADGKPVTDGYGRCTTFEIRWANEVQAYNCVKADGTGRTSLIEYHDMIFDGVKFSEQIRITPTEDIKMQLWYGLQGVGFGSVYSSIMFIDGTNRLVYSTSDGRTSGNNVTSGIKGTSTDHEVEIMVDTNTDLGKRTYYEGTEGAFSIASTGKAYFNIIRKFGDSQVLMEENTNYYLNGSYRFFPAVQ